MVVRRRVLEVLGTFGTVIADFESELLLILEMISSLEKPIAGFVIETGLFLLYLVTRVLEFPIEMWVVGVVVVVELWLVVEVVVVELWAVAELE
jgi:hypothetical protein